MKYLLIFGLTIAVIWLWQGKRRSSIADKAKARPPKPQAKSHARQLPATEIVACDVCSVHLPQTEALIGGHGVYCSEAHRRQAEG
ncbi:MAG: PP0621 family protein [Polaromonas sp.]|jgi:uncharacterized protein|nr:PP0621 family protein [Polaromonas sp.]